MTSLRIANCSGFFGDRLSAAREMVDGGPIDVLTGDWLAELTMLILAKGRRRDPGAGYARTFVTQMEDVMPDCLDRGIKVVSNAGGLAPTACAAAVAAVATRLGRAPRIATVEGDDLAARLGELRRRGVTFAHMDTGAPLGDRPIVTANAYLGGWGIAEALGRGADIVITGRVTDAALTLGPAAWHHGWARDDWDSLAGAVIAGHVIECGAQATGGNYAFFTEIGDMRHPAFPIAEVAADGSSVITKHEGHGGEVSVGTVTAQLLYEIGGPEYANPDVTARFDSITLRQLAPDRVGISGAQGTPPPPTSKVAINCEGGFRTTAVVYLPGLDIEAKADALQRSLWDSIDPSAFDSVEVSLLRTDQVDPPTIEAAMAELRITVRDSDKDKVGPAFTSRLVELGLSTFPGYFSGPPPRPTSYGVYWPALVPADLLTQVVTIDEEVTTVGSVPLGPAALDGRGRSTGSQESAERPSPAGPEPVTTAPLRRGPLGWVIGARSGDKGGNANLGVWVRSAAAFAWVRRELTVDRLQELLPETADHPVRRYELANMWSLNFVVVGFLGEGVASSSQRDAQAKSLGEYLRARFVDIPTDLLVHH